MADWFGNLFHTLRYYYSPAGLQELAGMGGIYLLIAVIFAETGLLIGFFMPGDSLLVVAGLLTAVGTLGQPFGVVLAALIGAAILGDWVNFWMGAKTGNRAWQWPDGRLFKQRHLREAHEFYEKYGGPAIALCRFVPIARTFVPFIAGVSRMKFRHFMVWNAIGGSAWVTSMLCLGYWLGQHKWLIERIDLIVLIVVAVSLLPIAVAAVKRWVKTRRETMVQKPAADK